MDWLELSQVTPHLRLFIVDPTTCVDEWVVIEILDKALITLRQRTERFPRSFLNNLLFINSVYIAIISSMQYSIKWRVWSEINHGVNLPWDFTWDFTRLKAE